MSATDHSLAINTLRFLAVDAVEKAASGHPGMPMGSAPMAYALWTKFLKFDPSAPDWADRDRFVLSAGHGSMLLYGLLHMAGYDLSLEDIRNFRQWCSPTPGHPEYGHTPGVETTTGPLGQGFGAAVGMAIAERHLAARFNKPGYELVDHRTYALVGDGCLQEGISSEAASLAGHLKLDKLTVLYDDNKITIDGPTSLSFTEDVGKRFEAYGWKVLRVADGNDVAAISAAVRKAQKTADRPTLVMIRTVIGYGAPKKQGTAGVHGSPLGKEEAAATKAHLGWPAEPAFHIPEGAAAPFRRAARAGTKARAAWEKLFAQYKREHPELAAEWERRERGLLPAGWEQKLPAYPADPKGMASRVASGKAINTLAGVLPEIIGGSADLAPSNNTLIESDGNFGPADPAARNLRFGVREHGMGAIANGIANHGMLRPYTATFLVFTDYMRPSIRLSALMQVPVVHVMTHDSIHLGEDGPTHQPVEHLASLRAIPNLSVIRPADANETSVAWRLALERTCGPTLLALSRQNLPTLDRTRYASADNVAKGGYVLREAAGGTPKAILIASGSEVHLALAAAERAETSGVPTRVVNLASWDLFEAQDGCYRDDVLPPSVTARVAVEAAHPFGWEKWVGASGRIVGIARFGASAPGAEVAEKLGITVDHVVRALLEISGR